MEINLGKLLGTLKKSGCKISVRDLCIDIKITDPGIIKPRLLKTLYSVLNSFEHAFFISVRGIPYCIMPDATDHLIYQKEASRTYIKTGFCNSCFLASDCPGWQQVLPLEQANSKQLIDAPKEIVIEITNQCNLNCLTCTIDKNRKINVKTAVIEKIINECKNLGIKSVRFTGGEPLLYKKLGEILSYAKDRGMYVLLNTNATVLDDAYLSLLRNKCDNILISLQGHNESSNNRLSRSDYPFAAKINNIIKLKKIVPIVRIGTVISRTLLDNFFKYYRLIDSLKVNMWELYRPVNGIGREFNITKDDISRIIELLYLIRKKGIYAKIANPVPFCVSKRPKIAPSLLVGSMADDGRTRMVYDGRGYFKPSYFIDVKLGNTIKEAWQNPFLRRIRSLSFLPGKCKSCEFSKWCGGGGRIFAKLAKGDYFSPDPLYKKNPNIICP